MKLLLLTLTLVTSYFSASVLASDNTNKLAIELTEYKFHASFNHSKNKTNKNKTLKDITVHIKNNVFNGEWVSNQIENYPLEVNLEKSTFIIRTFNLREME